MNTVTADQVRSFILEQLSDSLAAFDAEQLDDEFDLHDRGVIDSFGLIELIGVIEDHFQIEADLEELDPEELTKLGPLSHFIESQATVST